MVITEAEFSKLQNRDSSILERLYLHFKESIATYFMLKTFGNRSVSDDLVHETFCSIIESAPRLKSRDYLAFWVFTIAKRTLIAYQRRLFRQKKYIDIVKYGYEAQEDIHEAIHIKQKVLLLKMAIDTLNPEPRKLYRMRFEEENKIKEIADKLGKSEKAVDDMLVRIRKTLKKRMYGFARNFFSDEKRGG